MPLFFLFYYIFPDRFKNAVLLCGSLVFYFIGTVDSPYHFALFVLTIVADFAIGVGMEKYPTKSKLLFVSGVVLHLLSLFVFKYLTFLCGQVGIFVNLLLPIGISFYTFQGISYIADVFTKKTSAEKSLLNYAVYISTFAQLIAGPIVTYDRVKEDLVFRKITVKRVVYGLETFIFGLGLKVLLANPIGKLWSQVLAIGFESVSTPLAWMAIVAYSIQIYFDFFGYSLMAVGLGDMLGFDFPKNFDHPYTSLSMTEFWRRWHITLGSWFKEYVYIPLGGNRKGAKRTVINLFIVWLLTGIWHGAGYNFVIWGAVLFLIIVTEKFFIGKYLKNPIVGRVYMLILIPLSWAVFAITDVEMLGTFFTRLFPFFGSGAVGLFKNDWLKYLGEYWIFFAAGILLSAKFPYKLLQRIKNKAVIVILLAAVAVGSVYCMYRGFDDPFLYFRF